MKADDSVALVEVTRGEMVESIHAGAFCVMDSHGNRLASAGNPNLLTYPRSSMKPFQALPFIELGGAEAFGLTGSEIAILCASHSGTDIHKQALQHLHQKIGITEEDLACGVHWPGDEDTRRAMIISGEAPTPIRHNCSGKHTGMLAHAILRGYAKEDYLNPNHPVQVTIREALADMVGMEPDAMPLGIDGCSAPVYGIPLRNMAQAIAWMADPAGLSEQRARACRTITAAMMAHPAMVAGPGKFDTDLMLAAKGDLFCKGGAEGYQIIGVMPGVLSEDSPAIGVAIKIADGDPSGRARASVSLTILGALGVLGPEAYERLAAYGNIPIENWRKLVVGAIRPAFEWSTLQRDGDVR